MIDEMLSKRLLAVAELVLGEVLLLKDPMRRRTWGRVTMVVTMWYPKIGKVCSVTVRARSQLVMLLVW